MALDGFPGMHEKLLGKSYESLPGYALAAKSGWLEVPSLDSRYEPENENDVGNYKTKHKVQFTVLISHRSNQSLPITKSNSISVRETCIT